MCHSANPPRRTAIRAEAALPHHIQRPGHRIAGDGRAAGQRLDHHQPERVGAAGEGQHIGPRISGRQRGAVQGAKEMRARIFALQGIQCRAIAHHQFVASPGRGQERLDVLFHRHPANMQRHRPREAGIDRVRRRIRAELIYIGATRPEPRLGHTVAGQFIGQARGGDHHRTGRAVEAAQHTPHAFGVDANARRHIIGEAGVEAGGEGHALVQCPAAGVPAQRAFGGNVQRIGGKGADLLADAALRGHRQPDFGIAGHRHRPELIRRDHLHPHTALGEQADRGGQRADNAIDLGFPGIGDERELEHDCSFRLPSGPAWRAGLRPGVCVRPNR